MSAVEKLTAIQEKNKSYICLGLDLDPKKMPPDNTLSIKGMYEFAMNIIEATKDHVCAYKPNIAFYENLGHDGLSLLESIVKRMPKDIPIILDCKRGDIGNTASFYAEAMFERLNADWVTLSPYMGYDSMRPFLEYEDKGVFVLCLTSNSGSKDFQLLDVGGKPLYEIVAEKVDYWNKEDNCGLVVGATNPEQLKELRVIAKNMPLLIPGVGAQGGSLEKSLLYGTDNFKKPAVINVSRSVLYASNGSDYAEKARDELIKLNTESQKIKAGELSETTEQKTEPTPEESSTKTQVQGFTPPSQEPTQTEKPVEPVEHAEPVQEDIQPQSPPQQETKPETKPEMQTDQPTQTPPSEQSPPEVVVPPQVVTPSPIPTPPPVQEIRKESDQYIQPEKQEHIETDKPAEQIEPAEQTKPMEQTEPKRTPPPMPTPPPIPQVNREQQQQSQPEKQEHIETDKPAEQIKPAEQVEPAEQTKPMEQAEPKRTPPPMPTPPPIPQVNREQQQQPQPEKQEYIETDKPAEQVEPVEQTKPMEQAEPKRTPPPMPTPPPILPPNPEVMRRNREEQERRLKALQEQKQNQQNNNSTENIELTENSTSAESSSPAENSANENRDQQQQGNHKENFQPRRHNRNNR